jgi:phospholipase D-like protein
MFSSKGDDLLRTHKTRPAGGASIPLLLTLVMALLAGMLGGIVGGPARADDTTPPTDGASSATQPGQGQQSQDGLGKLVAGLAAPVLGPDDTFVLKRGLTETDPVGANDNCPTCTYTVTSAPPGWGTNPAVGGSAPGGNLMIWVPGAAAPGMYQIGYTVSDGTGPTTAAVLNVAVTPDDYNPPAGMIFSHPYRKGYRFTIRDHVLRTINSTPPGATIQAASWSFSSKAYRTALQAATARGVKVQLVLAWRNKPKNSDYRLLTRAFGTNVTPEANWVKKCFRSCRGVGGTMHSKMFMFSQVYRTPYVYISGSANLTDFAVTNQWNQMNTVTGDKAVYDEAVNVFTQMYHDAPAPYVETHFPSLTSYYYPRGRVSPSNDFMVQALAPVRCKGAVNAGKGGRTIVKIAMYAWYQNRGKWLAKRVRQLWQQGCQVQIVYAISSNPVKSILYSPAGRGRIPMRQILLTNTQGTPIYYLHDKWVSITGNYAGVPNNSVSFQGSFNFADLGFSSDEQFQMIPGRDVYDRFAHDFKLLWTDRQARAPSPVSKIPTIEGRYSQDDLRLGTGVYRYMDAD